MDTDPRQDNPDWASGAAAAVEAEFARRGREETVELRSVRPVSPDVVELVFVEPSDGELRGIRIDSQSVRSARWRISQSTTEELGFNLVVLASASRET